MELSCPVMMCVTEPRGTEVRNKFKVVSLEYVQAQQEATVCGPASTLCMSTGTWPSLESTQMMQMPERFELFIKLVNNVISISVWSCHLQVQQLL